MHFTCPAQRLQAALNTVTKALAVRSSTPILDGVLLETEAQGLRLICTDQALGIETLIEANILEEGRVVLPGKLFAEVARKLPPGEVNIEIDRTHKAVIRCMGSRTTLAGLSADEYPQLPEVESGTGIVLEQQELRDMIQKTSFAIAVDETRPILTGCLFEAEEDTLTLVALDGFRLALRCIKLPTLVMPFRAVVPGKVLSDLTKILESSGEPVRLTLGKSHILVDMGATRLTARLLEGDFIRYRSILPTEWLTSMEVPTAALSDAIDRASLIAREGKTNTVRFHIGVDQLTISSNAELGEVLEAVDNVRVNGKDLEIAFNVRYMSDVLKAVDDETLTLRMQSNISPCLIRPVQGDHYLYLVLPVRVYTA